MAENTFAQCSELTTAIVDPGVTFLPRHTFEDCLKLVTVSLPDSLTAIGESVFENCRTLARIDLPDRLAQLGPSAFNSSGLESVVIPDSLALIQGSTFRNCDSLVRVVVPGSVDTIAGYAFYDCDALTTVTLAEGVSTIGERTFQSCGRLGTIVLPASLSTIRDSAFRSCASLRWVYCAGAPSGDATSFRSSGPVVYHFPEYSTIFDTRAPWSTMATRSMDPVGQFEFALAPPAGVAVTGHPDPGGGLVTIPEMFHGLPVTAIADGAFANLSGLSGVAIPESVTSIGGSAFENCTDITAIALPRGLVSIGEFAFNGCSSLESIVLPDTVEAIGSGAFAACVALESAVFTGNAPGALPGDTFLGAGETLIASYIDGAAGFSPSPWAGVETRALEYTKPPHLLGMGSTIGVEGRVIAMPPAFGVTVGIEYSDSLSPDSWIDLGDFTPNPTFPAAPSIYIDFDPVRLGRPGGCYRAFLRDAG